MQTSLEIKSGEAQINENVVSVEYPENVTFLIAVILDISKDEAIDTKYVYPYRLEPWQEITEQSYNSLIDRAINGKEDRSLELKEKPNDRFLRSASAFANTNGGVIVLGISDDKKIKGYEGSEDTLTQVLTI